MNKLLGISEELLKKGSSVRITAYGSSMFPVIGTGDRITISPERNPKVGDMIVFRRRDGMICHRLVKVFEMDGTVNYQTRGDSIFGLDDPVLPGDILGKVIRIEMGRVSAFRRLLLFFYPLFRYGRLNTFLFSAMLMLKKTLHNKAQPMPPVHSSDRNDS